MQATQYSSKRLIRLISSVLLLSTFGITSSLLKPSVAKEITPVVEPRLNLTRRGGVITIGNTFGYDYAAGVPAPVVGVVGHVVQIRAIQALTFFGVPIRLPQAKPKRIPQSRTPRLGVVQCSIFQSEPA